MTTENSGTETTEVKTGEVSTEAAAPEATETATEETGIASEPTEEEKQAAQDAKDAEDAEKREAAIRASKEGTPEWLQKKIDKEVKRRATLEGELTKEREARIRTEERLRLLEEQGTKKPETKSATEAEEPEFPDMDNFASKKEWQDAVKKYNKDLVAFELAKSESAREAKQNENQQKTAQSQAATEWSKRVVNIVKLGEKDYADFNEVTHQDNLRLTPAMATAIVELDDDGHHVEYFLGQNLDEQERISKLSPVKQQMEIGRIADKLRDSRTKKPAAKASNAPAPVTAVKGGAAPSVDVSKMSDAEWYAYKQKQKQNSA